MSAQFTECFDRVHVTEDIISSASQLFNNNYGVWGQPSANGQAFGKPGSRVKLSTSRLRTQCLPEGSRSSYARITIDGVLAGNAFACRWKYGDRQVCWITQLVVHRDYRERNLATTLLLALCQQEDEIFGIMSSHPAACKALAKCVGNVQNPQVSLEFAQQHAADIISASPINYVKDAKLCGSLFSQNDTTGLVCGVNSDFFVDHAEPLQALDWFKQMGTWQLGDLPDGHEFLLLFNVPRRARLRSSQRKYSQAGDVQTEASSA